MTSEKSNLTFDAPEFVRMIRDVEDIKKIKIEDAKSYVQSLNPEDREAVNGCYVINCLRPCNFPIACTYLLNCSWCLWPGISTIPFGCFIVTSGSEDRGYYTNLKGDTNIFKVDKENETLACFGDRSSPCCLCNKVA